MIHKNKGWAYLTFLPLLGASVFAETEAITGTEQAPEASEQTIIEAEAPKKHDVKYDYFVDKSAQQMPGDASMLFHIPGLTLTESGGPLSPSQIRYRGLSGARFRVDLEGLWLNNPVNGMADANSMFLFAAKNLQTNAQSLSITLPTVEYPQAKGVFGYGSQNSIKIGGTAGTPLDAYSSIFIATQAYSTNGRFKFQSPDLKKDDPNNDFIRENNDQHRLQGLVKYQRKTDTSSAHALLAFNAHEGGVAGYAFSPTKNLRNQAIYTGMRAGMSQKINDAKFSLDIANSLFDYRTVDTPAHDERFLSSTHELTVGFESLKLPEWFNFDFANQIFIERAYELNKTRLGGGFLMNRTMRWQGRLKPSTYAQFSMLGFQEYGLVFKKDLGVSIEPSDWMSMTARLLRHQRLPTFMEMYAENRFFVGNPDLKKESVWDIELGSTMNIGQHSRMQVTAFMGYLSDVIVYVPFLATQLRPINVETASRRGLDLSLVIEPTRYLMIETKNSLLSTKNKATNARLPQAPTFLGLTKLRIGNENFLALSLQSRYRGNATANIYGTLHSKPYALFDTVVSARLFEYLGLSLSVTNIFNIKTARDIYETPLPGSVFFGQIEVGNVS